MNVITIGGVHVVVEHITAVEQSQKAVSGEQVNDGVRVYTVGGRSWFDRELTAELVLLSLQTE